MVATWTRMADQLDAQRETILAGEVRYFSRHLPRRLPIRSGALRHDPMHRQPRDTVARWIPKEGPDTGRHHLYPC